MLDDPVDVFWSMVWEDRLSLRGERKGCDNRERGRAGGFRVFISFVTSDLEVSDTLLAVSDWGASSSQTDDEEDLEDEGVRSMVEDSTAVQRREG